MHSGQGSWTARRKGCHRSGTIGQRHQGGGYGQAWTAPTRLVIGEHLHQQGKLRPRLAKAADERECPLQSSDPSEDQMMATPQVGAFVGENRLELIGAQGVQRNTRQHNLPAASG